MRSFYRFVLLTLAVTTFWGLSHAFAQTKKPGSGEPTPAQTNPAISFVASTSKRTDVFVAAANRASEICLTKSLLARRGGHLEMGSTAWSPDGTKVAFWVRDWLSSSDAPTRLYVAKADGTQLTLLRDYSIQGGPRPDFTDSGLNWSSSGKELIYYHNASRSLISVDAGTGNWRVFFDGTTASASFAHPAISPDVSTNAGYQGFLAGVWFDGSVDADGNSCSDIYVVPLTEDANGYLLPIDPSQVHNLTNTPGSNQFNPSWSPNGAEIAYSNDGVFNVVNITSGAIRTLPGGIASFVAADDRATWISDGRGLIYTTPIFGDWTLARIAADGNSNPVRYSPTNRVEFAPSWNPRWNPSGPGGF